MPTIEEYRSYGKEIEDILRLDSFAIAVKMIQREEEIPAEAVRPKRDRHQHLAQCQAFSLSRRDGETVAMLKEDHWCYVCDSPWEVTDETIELLCANPCSVRSSRHKLRYCPEPLVMDQFTADPTARVFEGRVYVYPSHDIPAPPGRGRANWFVMEDYHVFSSENLVDWTDGGVM